MDLYTYSDYERTSTKVAARFGAPAVTPKRTAFPAWLDSHSTTNRQSLVDPARQRTVHEWNECSWAQHSEWDESSWFVVTKATTV